ncbi:zinc finger CCCH domain-containing protein 54 [Rhodamnia argentea]|uniref:Zinc finger CCCH domain-containing protein 54 n=1 Tax=Rhodamnia argentea TaxID=178133 RepID=A0A8B8PP29_9MYRT|nr:zinc finger CCCH domain-containing protein 54 [Rhodamnia argentea]
MLKGIKNRKGGWDSLDDPACNVQRFSDKFDEIYGSDEFRMYAYKVKRCPRTRSHDWTECPYAHRGEKAQRRDPRKVSYAAVACPAFRVGTCLKGGSCELAHGVFEYWLHPARYRTRACNAGEFCQRKVCFFAHSPDQLRPETKYKCTRAHRTRVAEMDGSRSATPARTPRSARGNVGSEVDVGDGVSDLLRSLKRLSIRGGDDEDGDGESEKAKSGWDASVLDLSHLGWISDLVDN